MKYYIKKYEEPSGQLSPEYLLYWKNKNYPTFTNQGELKEKETVLDGTWFGNLFDKAYNYLNKNMKFKQGGPIHIKEKNKGKFTESAKRAGKSVQEHARDVVNNPKATKLQKKRALFALNAKKFKH